MSHYPSNFHTKVNFNTETWQHIIQFAGYRLGFAWCCTTVLFFITRALRVLLVYPTEYFIPKFNLILSSFILTWPNRLHWHICRFQDGVDLLCLYRKLQHDYSFPSDVDSWIIPAENSARCAIAIVTENFLQETFKSLKTFAFFFNLWWRNYFTQNSYIFMQLAILQRASWFDVIAILHN